MSHSANVSSSRRVAYTVLQEVAGGGYATDLLMVRTSGLDSRDAGLASQLVFGCLRFQGQLDYLIRHYSGRQFEQVENVVRILLRLGIFQLRYLDRIPPHAAIHETVQLAKGHRRAASGFVNAVLRKVNRSPVRWPDRSTELSCPEWMLDRWTRHFGGKAAGRIARAALEEPERYVRVEGPEALPGVVLESTEVAGCFRVVSGDTRGLRLQDIGSQSIVPLLNLQAGNTFLDLCSAPGNKTMQALETPVAAIACDVSLRRLRDVSTACPRVVLDATRPLPFRRRFDRILIDAPCSGTGTLSRNPEIKWRVTSEDFAKFRERQALILISGLMQLKPGGRLVYATCSLEQEENEEVVRQALRRFPDLALEKERWRLPGCEPGDGFYAAVITSGE